MSDLSDASGVSSTKHAAIVAGTSGMADFIDGTNEWGTKLRVIYDIYEWDGNTSSSGAVITMGVIPKGAKVLGFYVANSANTAAVTATLQLVDSDGNNDTISGTWSTWGAANQQFLPVFVAISQTVLDEEHTVTVTTGNATVADGTIIVVATLFLIED